MILIIDNYDSFTYNLVQYVGELGEEVTVHRNDKITLHEIEDISPERIIISPGPGRPDEAGISKKVINEFKGRLPILGVCLGHQSIAEVFGAKVVIGDSIMHGKVSDIFHNEEGLFRKIPSPFTATRYHSLVVNPDSLRKPLKLEAWTESGEVMALSCEGFKVWGVQFHPESVLTLEGKKILKNFLEL